MVVVFLHSRSSAKVINYLVMYLLLFSYIQMYLLYMCKYNIGIFDSVFVLIILATND